MLISLTAVALVAVAYWAFVTKPVNDEQEKEKRDKDRKAAAERAISEALRDDYCSLFNETSSNN